MNSLVKLNWTPHHSSQQEIFFPSPLFWEKGELSSWSKALAGRKWQTQCQAFSETDKQDTLVWPLYMCRRMYENTFLFFGKIIPLPPSLHKGLTSKREARRKGVVLKFWEEVKLKSSIINLQFYSLRPKGLLLYVLKLILKSCPCISIKTSLHSASIGRWVAVIRNFLAMN